MSAPLREGVGRVGQQRNVRDAGLGSRTLLCLLPCLVSMKHGHDILQKSLDIDQPGREIRLDPCEATLEVG